MDDSFFGFDTSVPIEDDGMGGIGGLELSEPPEDVFDALNDETFGSAINTDWEKSHEHMVKLDKLKNNRKNSSDMLLENGLDDCDDDENDKTAEDEEFNDLEINFSQVKLDDVDISLDEVESRVPLDPSVWANPIKPISENRTNDPNYTNPKAFLRLHFSNPFEVLPNQQTQQEAHQQLKSQSTFFQSQLPFQQPTINSIFCENNRQLKQNVNVQKEKSLLALQNLFGNAPTNSIPSPVPPVKMMSVEDLERSIRTQQEQQKLIGQQKIEKPIQQVDNLSSVTSMNSEKCDLGVKNPSLLIRSGDSAFKDPYSQQQPQHQQILIHQNNQLNSNIFNSGILTPKNLAANSIKAPEKLDIKIPSSSSQPQRSNSAFKENQLHSQHQQVQQIQQISVNQNQNSQSNSNFFNRPHSAVPPGFNTPVRPNFNFPILHPLNLMTSSNFNSVNNFQNQYLHQKQQCGFPPPPNVGGIFHFNMAMSYIQGHPYNNFPRPVPNLPVALNNFAMHPNFSGMRPMGPPPVGMPPPPRMPPHPALMNQMYLPPPNMGNNGPQGPPASSGLNKMMLNNQSNQRLMQEIQQNHPMLANRNIGHSNQNFNINRLNQEKQKPNIRSNGNLPDEYDEYANLMSTRDKHWLIGIQLSQLNTETPYIDDYYYTVYKEKKAKQSGEIGQSKTHKDNQLNHPFSQPKGHAQLVILSMGKNGVQNHRNGQNIRERRNSETTNNKDKDTQPQSQQQRNTYPPLQFENILGKFQYGSVTAPRKIIDMEIMTSENNQQQSNTMHEISAQRKTRYILLQIETLYKIVLKLEDLENPSAIATSLIVKERKEKEKQNVLEQNLQQTLQSDEDKCDIGAAGDGDNVNEGGESGNKTESASTSVSSSVSDKYVAYELESKDKLLEKILPYLTVDKVGAMMGVRKGKTLIRRILPHINDNPIRWTVWVGIFSCLQHVLKKDKDDSEGVLYSLYPEFKKQIREADMETCNKIANSLPLNDKKLNNFFLSKFCISSLVSLILRAENIYAESEDLSKSENKSNKNWSEFLSNLSAALNRTVENQTITAEIESSAINPLVTHLSRFKHLKLDSLLALFSQDKQQHEQ